MIWIGMAIVAQVTNCEGMLAFVGQKIPAVLMSAAMSVFHAIPSALHCFVKFHSKRVGQPVPRMQPSFVCHWISPTQPLDLSHA